MIYSIYKITNKINGKHYIGFSKNPNRRISGHKSAANKGKRNQHLYNAIRKYGWDNFEWTVLYQSKDYYHCLNEMESHFINEYNSVDCGYNGTYGGEHYIPSETSRLKLGQSLKGRVPWNKGVSGYSLPKGTRKSTKGIKRPPEVISKCVATRMKNGNTIMSDKSKAKMIATQKASWNTTEGKEKARQSALASPKVSCIYCQMVNNLGNHNRYHGAKCKSIK